MATVPAVQLPEENEEDTINDRRLWIGNLDARITEFVLLKLVQKFGKPERFDFMYHIAGPDKGKPKGYCFVTYDTKEIAEKAIKGLNGKMALSRRLAVHRAKEKYQNEPTGSSGALTASTQSTEKPPESKESTQSTIRAIEAKLLAMEETQKDFGLSEHPAAPPGTNRYSAANAAQKNTKNTGHNNRGGSFHNRRQPYAPHRANRGRRR